MNRRPRRRPASPADPADQDAPPLPEGEPSPPPGGYGAPSAPSGPWGAGSPPAWNGGHAPPPDAQQPPAWDHGRPPAGEAPQPAWNGGQPPTWEGPPSGPSGSGSPAWDGPPPSGPNVPAPPAWEGQEPAAWNGGRPPGGEGERDPEAETPRPSRRSLRLPAIKLPARPARGEKGPGALPPVAYFAAAGVVLVVALIAIAGLVVLTHDDRKPSERQPAAAPAGGPLPSTYSAASTTSVFAPIAKRTADPRPLTANEVFDKKTISDRDAKASLRLTASKLDARCADAVWGQPFAQLLQQSGCTQVTRGAYGDKGFSALVAIFNLADSTAADKLVAAADPRSGDGFVRPLGDDDAAYGQGFSTARGVAMGHYAVITWVRRADGSGSETDPKLVSLLVTIGPPPAIVQRVADKGGQG
ncbi:hypothetical protein [Actinoallomurus rhizosphaericola]|uniref:hypothetical protein n=1 Tax=Actinoallomurus rhizosphaericola TaxID=2952536 RepID=UPI002092E4D4|nr:hypothetical protein [Actinoallomurus rhizosphaericola]MCO5999651.1 hypothetical protein [Actinoallomurus rhizosphaericola]